ETLKILVNHNRLQPANVENPETVKSWTITKGLKDKNNSVLRMGNDVMLSHNDNPKHNCSITNQHYDTHNNKSRILLKAQIVIELMNDKIFH
ncbi:hypothetical protein BB561_003922, partial [Smittium simulii]